MKILQTLAAPILRLSNLASRVVQNAKFLLSPVDNRGGGWRRIIGEPYAGAWQNDDELAIVDVIQHSTVYACLDLISSDISKMSFLHQKMDEDNLWKGLRNSKLLRLLKRPNHYQNQIQFREQWEICKLAKGNAYILIAYDEEGFPDSLYVLDPDKCRPMTSTIGEVFYELHVDGLGVIEGDKLVVPAKYIMHDRMFCMFHPLVGVSPLYAAGYAAMQGLGIQHDSKRFFSNASQPGGLLVAPGAISEETANRLANYFNTNFTGKNSGRVAAVGDGLKFEKLRMSAGEAQLIEQLDWTSEDICRAFRVPGYKVGVGSPPNGETSDVLNLEYYSQCLQRHIESLEACLNDGLGLNDLDGERIELDLEALFRMDMESRMRMLGKAVQDCLIAPNEGRSKLNYSPKPGGDAIYMQQQNYSLEALAARDSKNPAPSTGSTQTPTEPAKAPAAKSLADLMGFIDKELDKLELEHE